MVAEDQIAENEIVRKDENWWASVLADEKNIALPVLRKPLKAAQKEPESFSWEKAQSLYQEDAVIELRVMGHNRGGVLVEGDGLNGFVPYSHLMKVGSDLDLNARDKALAEYVDQILELKVIECVPDESRIVFSERAAQAGAGRRQELFAKLKPGQCIEGQVTNVTNFGVFIDLGGVEGLIHISELSWGRVNHPSDIVGLNDRMNVQVLDVSPERCRVALSLKRLFDNPWVRAEEVYTADQVVPAKITTIVSFGAFARLDDGLEGLIHASEIPIVDGVSRKEALRKGQVVSVRILQIEPEKQRMGLSLKLNQ